MTAPIAPRRAPAERAGTHLSASARQICNRSGTPQGSLDVQAGVFQCGGELSNFCYWTKRLLSLDAIVWRAIEAAPIDRVEWVDHVKNVCYTVPMIAARVHGEFYDGGGGPRWGVPLDMATRSTPQAQGSLL